MKPPDSGWKNASRSAGNLPPRQKIDYIPSEPNVPRTREQIEAENDLNTFIFVKNKTAYSLGDGNMAIDQFITSRGIGKWGLLLSLPLESKYLLWYVEYQGKDNY